MASGNFKAAVANLRSAKWRSLLTMMGVIIGIALVVTVVSLGEGLKHQVVGQIDHLGSDVLSVRSGKLVSRGPDGQVSNVNLLAFLNSSTLTAKDIAALGSLDSVKEISPVNFVTNTASGDSNELNNAYVLGASPDLRSLLNLETRYGSFFTEDDASRKFAVVGANIAHRLYGQLNPLGHTITISGQDYIITGVLDQSSGGLLSIGQTDFNSAVLVSFEQSTKLSGGGTNILQILLRGKSSDVEDTINDVHKILLSSHQGHEDFSVLKQAELLRVVDGVANKLTGFISALAAISLLVGGICIMDIMLASVSERTREIGIRKAIGATNRQILKQFLTEGLVLTVSGGIVGLLLSVLVFLALHFYTNLHPLITVPVVLLAVFISIAVGVIFSIVPALKAARKDPIQALRGD